MVEYQVDLDSVYEIEGSKRPVYKLAKVHTQERNKFELLVQVTFDNGEVSEFFKSKPFLIKTKRINDEPAGTIIDFTSYDKNCINWCILLVGKKYKAYPFLVE